MTDVPQIVVGTYEEFILGYKAQNLNKGIRKCKLLQTFATHSHQASVRCIAANKQLMATSGADEYINIYDMGSMKISTVINYHDSTVTCLEFTPDRSHLVTANQNGDIAIFRCKDWNLVKLWKGAHKHANGVTSTSIHPTGSLLLTTGTDNILRFWNLIKGRLAYATNFSKNIAGNSLNFGLWSPTGKFYLVCIGSMIEVFKTATAAAIYEITAKSKITCAVFIRKNLLCIGTEDGTLEIHSVIKKKLFYQEQPHKSRLKSMTSFCYEVAKNDANIIKHYLATADSAGTIKLWYLKKNGLNYSLILKSEVGCDCRITCITIVHPVKVKKEKLKNSNTPNEKTDSEHTEPCVSVQKSKLSEKLKKSKNYNSLKNGNLEDESFPVKKKIGTDFKMNTTNMVKRKRDLFEFCSNDVQKKNSNSNKFKKKLKKINQL